MKSFIKKIGSIFGFLLQFFAYIAKGLIVCLLIVCGIAIVFSIIHRHVEAELKNVQGMYISEEPGLTYNEKKGVLSTPDGDITVIYVNAAGRTFHVYDYEANKKTGSAGLDWRTQLLVVRMYVKKDRIILKIEEDHVFDNQYKEIVLYKVEEEPK